MHRTNNRTSSKLTTVLLGAIAAIVVISIILFPDEAFRASLEGLTVWWKLVFPALMPFFILTELLTGLGVIQGVGMLLTPLMRFIFRLPGVSGWALASGLIVGFPAGAKITANLREKSLITQFEAERLNALSHLCSPLFLLTVVGVGFLHSASLGATLAVIHYVSALAVGLLLRIRKSRSAGEQLAPSEHSHNHDHHQTANGSIWQRSSQAMREAYLEDGRSFGKLLGDSVTSSVQTLMLIGGYMMIFSVIIHVVTITHAIDIIRLFAGAAMSFFHLHTDMAPQWTKALFEIYLGSYSLSQTQDIPLVLKIAFISAFLGWGGLSAHAQAAGFHFKTDVRYSPFLIARTLHAAIAFMTTFLLWKPLESVFASAEPSFLRLDLNPVTQTAAHTPLEGGHLWTMWSSVSIQLLLLMGVMILLSLITNLLVGKKFR
ncbi:nucleoside recognition domain-containing protein [Paenibacillus hexagrammi]|uniref:Sporulation protein n=1 Tax=Paenibacillus hexagrammi TaxID=2908839 RepID=A0ABY3SPX2_9BACL|nr:nucleoside recognition domain-containing protein [Paenibacillus sp. YPD9-1]UJF35304.1 sporulation protein [Paenibacillus sp. YPD9-1]